MRNPILIIGSLNIDLVIQTERIPQPGETVRGHDFQTIPGGKGANQACAVGRLGGNGFMIGCVGEDAYGKELLRSLASSGVDISAVKAAQTQPTGVASITVGADGQNQIVIAGGANDCLSFEQIARQLEKHAPGFALFQLESPLEVILPAVKLARQLGFTTILDPAPAQTLEAALLESVDILTPNETEALTLLGQSGNVLHQIQAEEISNRLLDLGPKTIILKMGSSGARFQTKGAGIHFNSMKVDAVDSTAAGDTFNGALAVALSEGSDLSQAIEFANAAAALSVTKLGAQVSIPYRAEVDAFLKQAAS